MQNTSRKSNDAEFNNPWADFVRTHPRELWYPYHKAYLDAWINQRNFLYAQLAREKGKEFVRQLRLSRK